jgi:L-seryl-tRNA(Ser) seleniumtransferase
MTADLRDLPAVGELLEAPEAQRLLESGGHALTVLVLQQTLAQERNARQAGEAPWTAEFRFAQARDALQALLAPPLKPVINATGVVLHTNLGRAPLAQRALQAVGESAGQYSNLEYDLERGKRGQRHTLVARLLQLTTGAEAAAVVNNCAAAVLLALATLARGKEVLVSRGQLVEIGDAFRMPDVMRLSGARLVEVGTTNRTRIEDYERAITPKTGALLKVHASNFQVVGFTEEVEVEPLAALAHRHQIPLIEDLGSGALLDTRPFGLKPEPRVQHSLRAGADLVLCSGDKLLGGPQCGLILGTTALVARVIRHPLARVVRVDKMTLAALAATLQVYLRGDAPEQIPIWHMLAARGEELRARAEAWARALPPEEADVEVVAGESTVGGGSLPGETLPTFVLSVRPRRARVVAVATRLRAGDTPVVARIEANRLLLDPRTVLPSQDSALLAQLQWALNAERGGS